MMRPEQLGLLLENHGPQLILFARQWCSTPEDAVQAAFLKLAQQRPVPAEPLPWLYQATRNLAMTAGRTERRRRHHEGQAAAAKEWFTPAEASPMDAAAATEALVHLPLEEREVIVAHLWGGLTFEQIGTLIGSSAATAHRRYVSGLAALREHLEAPCPAPRHT